MYYLVFVFLSGIIPGKQNIAKILSLSRAYQKYQN